MGLIRRLRTTIGHQGKVSSLSGSFHYTSVTATTVEIPTPFRTVSFNTNDQHGVAVTGSTVYVSGYGNIAGGYGNIAGGTMLSLPEGTWVSHQGKMGNINGGYNDTLLNAATNSINTPFRTFTFKAYDQNGQEAPGISLSIEGWGNLQHDQSLSLPYAYMGYYM